MLLVFFAFMKILIPKALRREEVIGLISPSSTCAAPDISPGDPWLRRCRHSNTLTIASEADVRTGSPFVVFDGPSGAVGAARALEWLPTSPKKWSPFSPGLASLAE